MYEVYFYKDKNGKEPVKEYLEKLSKQKDKDSRIKYNNPFGRYVYEPCGFNQ